MMVTNVEGANTREISAVSLLRDADAAMYQAKANGRARVAIFDNTVPRAQTLGLRP